MCSLWNLKIKSFNDIIILGEELENLKSVTYSSRFALGLFYDKPINYFDGVSWVAKYVPNDDILCFCSLDNKKRSMET